MAYDHRTVVQRVREELSTEPFMSLEVAATRLGVSRHTIIRALKEVKSSYAKERRRFAFARLDAARQDGRLRSTKEMAAIVGCSTRSLARLMSRR